LSAFANSDGGTLLIGVRDNGSIAGVSSDEEYYMIDAAAALYCQPPVAYTMSTHTTESKTVLEVNVEKGSQRPYKAKNENGDWISYIRVGDQNFVANRVVRNVWKRELNRRDILITLKEPETKLLSALRESNDITLSKFKRIASINTYQAEKILVNFILLGVIQFEISETGCRYIQGEEFDREL
jgi:predicted HTH transcriptional regulator